ncbi:MAG: cupin domain-containing protein [Methanomassiliicoccales archaeon]|nr:cupin domain-containing protein [Methanomassiliicoccales archaeon]
MSSSEKLGTRIRTYRERLGLDVEELAKNSGVDTVLIESIEKGDVYPAINVLVKIARALGQRLGTFMDDQFVNDPLIVAHGDRQEETSSVIGGVEGHYHYYPLGKGKTDRHMEPFFIKIDPCDGKTLSSHEGEEFIIVVSGEVELIYGKATYDLKAGDSMYYNSLVPHYLGAKGDSRAEIYATLFMPF